MFTLYTCSYNRFTPSMGTAIQTSRGRPRFRLRYSLDFKLSELMPARSTFDLPEEEFAERYIAALDEIGTDHLTARFGAIATATAEPRLVLLCFEDLTKDGTWCHRSIFADFWQARTGQLVEELGCPVQDGGRG